MSQFQILKPSNTTVIKAIKPPRIHKPRARNKDIKKAVDQYVNEVREGEFPDENN